MSCHHAEPGVLVLGAVLRTRAGAFARTDSDIGLVIGLALDWSDLETPATVLYWLGLLLGAYTFAPGAIGHGV